MGTKYKGNQRKLKWDWAIYSTIVLWDEMVTTIEVILGL